MAAAIGALLLSNAEARPSEVAAVLPSAAWVGEARYEVLALAIFDAELWAPQGAFSWDRAFALSLTYQRSISARALVNRTLREMAERGGDGAALAALRPLLLACFADVRAGDRITGVSIGVDTARFFYNGQQRCEIASPGFRRSFFGIWLDGEGADRAFSQRLLGG
ncbi:MAG: chalcone isomerase family protein [Caulobacterales bacterium]|nr:chalcone isomerase family protein [Caulobacterales bacterium]